MITFNIMERNGFVGEKDDKTGGLTSTTCPLPVRTLGSPRAVRGTAWLSSPDGAGTLGFAGSMPAVWAGCLHCRFFAFGSGHLQYE